MLKYTAIDALNPFPVFMAYVLFSFPFSFYLLINNSMSTSPFLDFKKIVLQIHRNIK